MTLTKTEQSLISHLAPVEYGVYHDAYLCGIAINNKDEFMFSVLDKIRNWTEKNGGRCSVISGKVISHRLSKKGFVVQIVFPSFCSKRDMKNVMSTLYPHDTQLTRIPYINA